MFTSFFNYLRRPLDSLQVALPAPFSSTSVPLSFPQPPLSAQLDSVAWTLKSA